MCLVGISLVKDIPCLFGCLDGSKQCDHILINGGDDCMKNQLILMPLVCEITMIGCWTRKLAINEANKIIPYKKGIELYFPCRIVHAIKLGSCMVIENYNRLGI